MRVGTIQWRDSSSAVLVADGRAAPIRELAGRSAAYDVSAVIHEPLRETEVRALCGQGETLSSVRWLPPVLRPPKNVLCVGRNYAAHVEEGARAEGLSSAEMPQFPIWFSKAATALVGCGGDVVSDAGFTRALDYEGELALVIGRRCKGVGATSALEYVYGYTLFNDVTARDVQQSRKQWLRGKSADTYAPCGPWIVTADEIPDPQDLSIKTTVNGIVRQADDTRNMIFDVATLIADISAGMTLEPGDIIATGTPSGVAWGMESPTYLVPGDEVVVEIEEIGRLWNRVAGVEKASF